MSDTVYDIPVNRIDGAPASLGDYKGKVILVVNVASKCGLTPQYAGLEKLYEDFKDKGLVVTGFPANEFGAQEPGTNDEIADFCTTNFGVKFPMFEKIVVKGEGQHPLYASLTKAIPAAEGSATAPRRTARSCGTSRSSSSPRTATSPAASRPDWTPKTPPSSAPSRKNWRNRRWTRRRGRERGPRPYAGG
jgi:glutathione peroxidase